MPRLFSTLLILASALAAHAGIQASDFNGVGKIYVLKSDSWNTASPKEKVGCLDDHGKFVHISPACGTFSRRPTYPYTLSTVVGNCTFDDDTQARNTDSVYGTLDYAWSCKDDHNSELWDEFYTVVRLSTTESDTYVLTLTRMVSPTSSSASATLHVTTMPKKHPRPRKLSLCGNTGGDLSRWASRQATSSCNFCGRSWATYPSVRARAPFRAHGSGLKRVCKSRLEVRRRKVEVECDSIWRLGGLCCHD